MRIRTGLIAVSVAMVWPGLLLAQDVVWRMGHFVPKNSSYMKAIEEVPERIRAATDGRVEIQLYHSLVKGPNLPDAVRDGRLDVVAPLHPWTSGTAPSVALAELPGLFQDFGEYQVALDAFLEAEYRSVWKERFNGVLLASGVFDRPVILSNKPLNTADDFEGVKIRVPSVVMAQFMESLGAKPVELPFGEIAPAMDRGVVDAVMTDAGTSFGMGFYDVADYVNLWNVAIFSWPVVVNQRSWQALPDDLRDTVAQEFKAIQRDHFEGYLEHNDDIVSRLESNGMTVVRPSQDAVDEVFAEENLQPLYDRYLRLCEERGRSCDALLAQARALGQQ